VRGVCGGVRPIGTRVRVDAEAVSSAALQVFAEPGGFAGMFVVVEPGRMRIRQVGG